MTTCTLSNLQHLGHSPDLSDQQSKGPLVATIPGAWAGDALDNLYNVGGPGQWSDGSETWHSGLTYPTDYVNKNQMAIGLANGYAYNGGNTWDGKKWGTPGSSTEPTGYAARVSVDYSCTAELHAPDGSVKPVPVAGLVFADAEASSRRYGIKSWATTEWTDEWIQANTDQDVTWRVLDTMRSDPCVSRNTGKQVTADAEVSDGGHTLRLMPSDEECVYQSGGSYSRPNGLGGPDAVMFMEGATKATITMQGSGYSAVALGLIVATDFGDAPESYGYSGALFQPKWKGGEVSATTDAFGVQPQATMYLDQSAPRLGEHIDAEGRQIFSADARGDDDNALLRVINFPPRGIGARTVENLQTASNEQGITLWQAACNAGAKATKITAFVRLIEALRNQVGQMPLSEIIVGILKDSGLIEHYKTQKGDNQDRLDNLDELVNAAIEFKPEDSNFEILPDNISDDPAFPILAFLSNAALESGENQAGAGEKAVQLMTVHASKGLEFNAVFLTGMEEGRFPSEMSLAERGGLEEERRLMYVAITRARKRLYITMAQQRMLHGQTQFGIVSRFVEEIPPEVLHYLSVKKAAYDSYGSPRQTAAPKDKIIDDYKQPQTYAGFRIGQNVRHAKFGTGVIIDAVDKGESARLTINFGKQGVKELDTKFAKLEEM